jgi:hypothetical protein
MRSRLVTRVDARPDGTIGFHSEMGYQEKRIQDKRSITGLIPPVFLGTKKRQYSIPISNTPIRDLNALIIFTSVIQTVIVHLQTLSIQIHSYLDDSLIKDFDQQTLVSQTEMGSQC